MQLESDIQLLSRNFNQPLLELLEKSKVSFESIRKLNLRLAEQQIDYESDFTSDESVLAARKAVLIGKIRALKRNEGEEPPINWETIISAGFKSFEDFYAIDTAQFSTKLSYIEQAHRNSQNAALQKKQKELADLKQKQTAQKSAKDKISLLKKTLTDAERKYSEKTIADIELIFHIYSGRLIQNYQQGLGLFIERGDGSKLQFCTAERSQHDATLSMSSGQISALSLAFFLSLNRVYSKTSFVLIDDPTQSLDDINIASLTDLLRCELKDRQLIMSSHEDDITAYMRYRFDRAGLSQKSFNMKEHVKDIQH